MTADDVLEESQLTHYNAFVSLIHTLLCPSDIALTLFIVCSRTICGWLFNM